MRVPAPEIEQLVLDGIRVHLKTTGLSGAAADRDLIERHVDRVIVRPQAMEVRLMLGGSVDAAEPPSGEPETGLASHDRAHAAVGGSKLRRRERHHA
jgi:hypothetical protein